MSRTEQRKINRRRNLRIVFCSVCLFVSIASLSYAKIVSKENFDIRSIIESSKEIPLSIKREIGVK